MLTLALFVAILAQDTARLVEELGSDARDTRGAAERALLKLGAKARDALQVNLFHENPEVRLRVRALLADARMLPINEAVREPMRALQTAAELVALERAARALLKTDRRKLTEALVVAAKEGDVVLRARAGQLADILGMKCDAPLRYGILLLATEASRGGRLSALEIFINDSPGPVSILDRPGAQEYDVVELDDDAPDDEEPEMDTPQHLDPATEMMARAGIYMIRRKDLAPFAGHPGRYVLTLLYESIDWGLDKRPDGFWTGKLKSNRVEVRVK